ncbi:hypothetical protein EAG_08585 [Camponotus floridanus]|uniref:Uncharacterized protein n=1 Tax=Camponotus floridanus TaxID=104421 RepID=E1ZWY2_CAMFO|nr:hypothetical protein EAG_08585 [Camponotus floridanus]
MHSKSCYALFLLALVACQAAPSHKIIEKSNNETEAKLAKEDLKLENTGADKDRAKKSTTFCVQVHSGKEEIVPCKQELKETPVINIKSPEYKPQIASAPTPLIQYPVSNIVVQQPLLPSSSVPVHEVPQVIHPTGVHVPIQQSTSSFSTSFTAPQSVLQPISQQHLHVQTPQQHFSVPEPVPQVHLQQPVVPAPAPTPIINIIPAPAAPCEKLEPQPPQQIHTVHAFQPPQPAPQSLVIQHAIQSSQLAPQSFVNHPVIRPQPAPQPPAIHEIKPLIKPIKLEQEKPPQLLPVPQHEISVPVADHPCKSDVIFAPPSPVELIYREEQPAKLVEYVPVSQESYECSCRSEHQSKQAKPPKHHVTLYPSSGRMSLRSPMSPLAVQYNPSIMGSEDTSPVFATQIREAEERHHHKKKLPLHLSVQYPAYSSFNTPTYESNSYLPSTYNSYPYYTYSSSGTYSSYPATNSYSNEYSYPYSTVPLITVNTGGPFYRNLENENSQEVSTDNKSIQKTLSNVEDVSFNNQKRGAISTQFTNDKQKETTEELSVEKENIKQIDPKTDQILKQKEE